MVLQEFRRQLFWALCILESTRVLQILVTDAHRSLDRVGQFKVLDTLQVSLDHTLTATTSKGRLTIRPDALAGCPAVKEVTLQDSVVVYPAVEISSWTPVHLPQLTTLNLNGTRARLLHPDTLHSTVSLELLTLVMADDNLHRSEWTWGWHLPHLRYLDLCSEFAFSFQSRMLRQTPSLAQLCLINILSEGDHELTVTIDKLRDHGRPVPEGESTTGFTSLPNMTHIMLVTGWTVGPQFWQTLFRKVMPSIVMIREAKTSGLTLKDWVDATLGLEKLRFAGTILTVKYKEPWRLV
ncbi:hypothetical protein BGX30_005619 [Mortierella sp. GBA39]|nr:hypothetical protein BGX30_005619 [Mortierella sp. GBA39]